MTFEVIFNIGVSMVLKFYIKIMGRKHLEEIYGLGDALKAPKFTVLDGRNLFLCCEQGKAPTSMLLLGAEVSQKQTVWELGPGEAAARLKGRAWNGLEVCVGGGRPVLCKKKG